MSTFAQRADAVIDADERREFRRNVMLKRNAFDFGFDGFFFKRPQRETFFQP